MHSDLLTLSELSLTAGKTGHLQGIAADPKTGDIFWSFTTLLIKTDSKGNILGSVSGLIGHLGCIAFSAERGELWGSLELKDDSIGRGILKMLGREERVTNAFYAVVFDTEKITKENMDAEGDGVMLACHLPEVTEDYLARLPDGTLHRHGCSGIDGITLAPKICEDPSAPTRLYVAYGIYGDTERSDNDDQVILSIDPDKALENARPLKQSAPHIHGTLCEEKLFLRTGNTEYGIQNLEYDCFTDQFFAAVYPGKKPEFSNPTMFVFPRKQSPELIIDNQKRLIAPCKEFYFPLGSTGLYTLENGEFLVSECFDANGADAAKINRRRFTGQGREGFERV